MGFHLGSDQFKINLGGQTYKVRVETTKQEESEENIQEYTLTIYWRPGVQDVEVIRTSSQNSKATLTRLYSGDRIYIGDTLEIAATKVDGFNLTEYQRSLIVTGNTEIYIEPTGETPVEQAQEIYLPDDFIVEITPNGSDLQIIHEYGISITADFELDLIWNNLHWGNTAAIDIEYLTSETPLEIYEMPLDWYYELQAYNGDSFSLTSEQQAMHVRKYGKYLGAIWVDYDDQDSNRVWYITYKKQSQVIDTLPWELFNANDSHELILANNYSISVAKIVANNGNDFDAYEFTADFDGKFICSGCNWGYQIIDSSYPTINNTIDIYEFDTYNDQGYQETIGTPELEASYIAQYGNYLGSIYVDDNNCWQVIYKEDLANG